MSAVQPARPYRPGWLPVVDAARCTGCGWCVASCDLHLLSFETVQWRKVAALHDAQQCTGCSDCAVACPFGVIRMRKGGALAAMFGEPVYQPDGAPERDLLSNS